MKWQAAIFAREHGAPAGSLFRRARWVRPTRIRAIESQPSGDEIGGPGGAGPRAPRVPERVRVLDKDPELAAVVPGDERELALTRAVAPVARVKGGPWSFRPPRLPGSFGLLVLDGLYGARISFGEHAHLELVGAGDLLRPWVGLGEYQSVPAEIGWQTFEPGTVAFLDADFARAVSAWPQLAEALMHRLVMRNRRLNFQLALTGIKRLDERLLIALWHFADRWGRVTASGVRLPLPLTHSELGMVIGATRPSVTSAIGDLRRAGSVSVDRTTKTWTLHGDPPDLVVGLHRRASLPQRVTGGPESDATSNQETDRRMSDT